MMKIKVVSVLFMMTAAMAFAQSGSPTVIPFQGRLTNQANEPYTNGQYNLIFNLYEDAVGGKSKWTEQHDLVGVINGMVNLFLGSKKPFADAEDLDFSKTLYLGITIDADKNPNSPDPEMIPRQMIIPAFHAKNAEKLNGYDWSAILVDGEHDPKSGYIEASKIEENGIGALQIASNAVGSGELAANSVHSADIVNGEVKRDDIDELDLKASENDFGLVQRATDQEAAIGTDTERYVTPKQLNNAMQQGLRVAYFREKQNSGTGSSDSLTAGQFDTRTLNDEVFNTIHGASLLGNQVTLPAGTYKVHFSAPVVAGAYVEAVHKARLRNISDNKTTAVGNNVISSGSEGDDYNTMNHSEGYALLVLDSEKSFEVQSYTVTGNQNGGHAVGSGEVEVYSDIFIEQLTEGISPVN